MDAFVHDENQAINHRFLAGVNNRAHHSLGNLAAYNAAFAMFTILAVVALVSFALVMSSSDAGEGISEYNSGHGRTSRTKPTPRGVKAIIWFLLTAFPLGFIAGGSLMVEIPTRVIGGGFLLAYGSIFVLCCWPFLVPTEPCCGWFRQYDSKRKRRTLVTAGFSCFVLCVGFIILAIYYGKTRKYIGYYSGPMRLLSVPETRITGCKFEMKVFWGLEWGCPQSPHTLCNTTAIYSPITYAECLVSDVDLENILNASALQSTFYEENTFPPEQPPWENQSWPQLTFHGDCETCTVLESSYLDQFEMWGTSNAEKIKLAGIIVSSIGAAGLAVVGLMVFVKSLPSNRRCLKASVRPTVNTEEKQGTTTGNEQIKREEKCRCHRCTGDGTVRIGELGDRVFDGEAGRIRSDHSPGEPRPEDGDLGTSSDVAWRCPNCFQAAASSKETMICQICGWQSSDGAALEAERIEVVDAGEEYESDEIDLRLDPESGQRSYLAEENAHADGENFGIAVENGCRSPPHFNDNEAPMQHSGKQSETSGSVRIHSCAVCLVRKRTHLAMPCHHLCFCERCASELQQRGESKCPLCNKKGVTFERVYF